MNINSQFVKKGVFTSRESGEANQFAQRKEQVETKKEVVTSQYENVRPQITINRPHITIQELNQTKYANSQGYNISHKPEVHFIHHNNVTQSHFVPPPPEKFLVSSGHNYSIGSKGQPSQLPIHSTHANSVQGQYIIQPGNVIQGMPVQTIQTVPIYQNIKKTFIPHHIYNEIPILNSQTKHYAESQYEDIKQAAEDVDEEQLNDADEKMMHQYQKLYQTYLQEKSRSQKLERRLIEVQQQFRNRDGNSKEVIKEIIQTKEVYVNRPVKIDQKQLLALIMKKLRPNLNDFFDRKKSSCLNKLRNILKDHQSSFKTSISRSTQQLSTIRLKSN